MNTPIISLAGWLDAATAGLPVSAAQKFRDEITDHFAEAMRDHVEAGMPIDEAERAALIDLGHADAVGRRLRDAHFSRAEYRRGETAMLLVFGAFGAELLLSVLSWQRGPGDPPHPPGVWITLAYLATGLASAVCCLLGLRAGLTLLGELGDIRAPRWGWRLFAACYGAAALALTFGQAWSWQVANGGSPEINGPPAVMMAFNQGLMSLSAVNRIGMLAAGALMAAFCLAAWRRKNTPHPLAVLLGLGAVAGAGMAAINGLWLAVSLWLPLSDFANTISLIIAAIYLVPYLSMQVLLARLLGRMRRPGALLAG